MEFSAAPASIKRVTSLLLWPNDRNGLSFDLRVLSTTAKSMRSATGLQQFPEFQRCRPASLSDVVTLIPVRYFE